MRSRTGPLAAVVAARVLGVAAVGSAALDLAEAGTFPGKNGLIAYAGSGGWGTDIFAIPAGGGQPTNITDSAAVDEFQPSW